MRKYLSLLLLITVLHLNAQTLKIYGGEDHKEYLGKLTNPYDSESIWNKYGEYGSKYNSKSIWNKYGDFGSKYNAYSPWNKYSNDPPVIVNDRNEIVGYFTCSYKATPQLQKVMLYILEHFDEVADDPKEFYDKYLK